MTRTFSTTLSAHVIHQLAQTHNARLVVTVRTGGHEPDAITALWKDELLARLDLEPLSVSDSHRMIESTLGGAVDSRSAAAILETDQRQRAVFAGNCSRTRSRPARYDRLPGCGCGTSASRYRRPSARRWVGNWADCPPVWRWSSTRSLITSHFPVDSAL